MPELWRRQQTLRRSDTSIDATNPVSDKSVRVDAAQSRAAVRDASFTHSATLLDPTAHRLDGGAAVRDASFTHSTTAGAPTYPRRWYSSNA